VFPSQPRSVQLLANGKQILVCGNSNDVLVLDLATLTVVSTLTQSNWVTHASIQAYSGQNIDHLFTVTIDGMLRSWPLQEALDKGDMMPVREQRIDVFDALDMSINPFNRSMLVVLTSTQLLVRF